MITGIIIGMFIGATIMVLVLGLCRTAGRSELESNNIYLHHLLNEVIKMSKYDEELQEFLMDRYIKEFCYG